MKRSLVLILAGLTLLLTAPAAQAYIDDWQVNINGYVYYLGDPIPGVEKLGFSGSDLGIVTVTIDPGAGIVGPNDVLFLFDYHLLSSLQDGGAMAYNAAGASEAWEIDYAEFGDIFDNFEDGNLDQSWSTSSTDDWVWAMGWKGFHLDANQGAIITLYVGSVAPASGFYINQYDKDVVFGYHTADIFAYTTLEITGGDGSTDGGDDSTVGGGGSATPEPGTMLLLGSATGLMGWIRRRRRN